MKNRKNRTQRQEVRRMLAAMRNELKDYRLHYEDVAESHSVLRLNEVMQRARQSIETGATKEER